MRLWGYSRDYHELAQAFEEHAQFFETMAKLSDTPAEYFRLTRTALDARKRREECLALAKDWEATEERLRALLPQTPLGRVELAIFIAAIVWVLVR